MKPLSFANSRIYPAYRIIFYNVVSLNEHLEIVDAVDPSYNNAWFLIGWYFGEFDPDVLIKGVRHSALLQHVSPSLIMLTDGECWYQVAQTETSFQIQPEATVQPPPKAIVAKFIKSLCERIIDQCNRSS